MKHIIILRIIIQTRNRLGDLTQIIDFLKYIATCRVQQKTQEAATKQSSESKKR